MQYLISYFIVGIFFASALLLHGVFVRSNIFLLFVATIFLWPLMILFAPDAFLRSEHDKADGIAADKTNSDSTPTSLKDKLYSIFDTTNSFINIGRTTASE